MTSSPLPPPGGGATNVGNVGMGEISVARDSGLFRTVLGSCVGLSLYDRRRRIGGLAHIMLPDSRGQGQPAGKYADTAVRELIRLLDGLAGDGALRLTAKLAGGAKMFPFQTGIGIGEQNVQAVERLLAAEGIVVAARCCGGEHGRRMTMDVSTGIVTITTVGEDASTIL